MHEYLPVPVGRYFRHVLKSGQAPIRSARILQEGQFRLGKSDRGWRSFTARQRVSTTPPGFVWDARIQIVPFVGIHVRDAYQAGTASMRATLGGLVPIVNQRGKPELEAGALQRYLAEAVWLPTALLSGHGVTWVAIDDNTAEATLSDSGIAVSMQFRFNETGEIVSAFTPNRFREVKGRYEPTPWLVRLWNYQEQDGIRIPRDGEVAWELAGVRLPYWRGRIVEIEYDFDE